MNRKLLLVLVLLVTACYAATSTSSFSGKVVAITDGDTIRVMHNGKPEKIRLNGIDCPEMGQDFGNRAKQAASSLAFGKTVKVIVKDHDRYGRTVADVVLPDGRILNEELVRQGMAWWYRQYAPDSKTLRKLEAGAKANKTGLWSQKNPTSPWEFRHPSPSANTTRQIVPKPAKDSAEIIVHVTRTGHKYHADGCRYLARSDIPIKLKDAKSQGYTPCSVCSPPG